MTVVKIIELVGSSTKGWTETAENALMEASETVRNIVGMDVIGCTAKVEKQDGFLQSQRQDSVLH